MQLKLAKVIFFILNFISLDSQFCPSFRPVLSYYEISQRLDIFRLPHVIQRYGVPAPQDDQYRRHDQAVYSMWMIFVSFCSLDTIVNPLENEADMGAYFHPEFESPHSQSLHESVSDHHDTIFLDETLPVNPFINRARLAVFRRMSLGLSADIIESNQSVTPIPKARSRAGTGSRPAYFTPGQIYSRWSNEYERDQVACSLERERGNQRQLQDGLLDHHRGAQQVPKRQSVYPSCDEGSSMDDFPDPFGHISSCGSGEDYQPKEEMGLAQEQRDFNLGSFSCMSADSAVSYNSCFSSDGHMAFQQMASHFQTPISTLPSTPNKQHYAVSPTSVADCLSPRIPRDSNSDWSKPMASDREQEIERQLELELTGMMRIQLSSPFYPSKSQSLSASASVYTSASAAVVVPRAFPYLQSREEDTVNLPSYLFRAIS